MNEDMEEHRLVASRLFGWVGSDMFEILDMYLRLNAIVDDDDDI